MSNKLNQKRENNTYPYLIISHQDTKHKRNINCQQPEYLNVKLDFKRQSRQIYLQKFNHKETESLFMNAKLTSNMRKEEIQGNTKSLSQSAKKKAFNPEKMLETLDQIISKQHKYQCIQSKSLNKKLKHPKIIQEHRSNSIKEKLPKQNCLDLELIEEQKQKLNAFKAKRSYAFQKMLRKCEKLKQIYKYEHELVNIKKIEEQPIRFYTQPIKFQFQDPKENEQPRKIQTQKQKLATIIIIRQPKIKINSIDNLKDTTRQQKILEIKRYKNQSALRVRQKLAYKKLIMKQQYQKQKNQNRSQQMMAKLKKLERLQIRQYYEKDLVCPWQQGNDAFDFSQII